MRFKVKVRLGTGAGFADDRVQPAVDLIERGALDYLVFECLAERTIALAQLQRIDDPSRGYNEWLEERMIAVLPAAARHGTKIITNMGAANPRSAGARVVEIAERLGLHNLTVVVVLGDDVLELIGELNPPLLAESLRASDLRDVTVSANAYLGIEGIVDALELGADVVITGRVADPSLFLAPLVHELGWKRDNWSLLAAGTVVGHLLECGAQVTGGYFSDPGMKEVDGLENLGFPFADVFEDGTAVISKLPSSGGLVSLATVTEQLLYEVHDPTAYVTPDVVANFAQAQLREVGPNAVEVTGILGREAPHSLKVSIGYADGFLAEGQISYCGTNCVARGRQALAIVEQRLAHSGLCVQEAQFSLIGVDAIHRGASLDERVEPTEVRARVVARTTDEKQARLIGREVVSLWLNGPAGGAAASRTVSREIAIASTLVPRSRVEASLQVLRTR